MLGIYTWSVLITGIFFTSFGLFAYLKNKKELSNKLFGMMSLAFAIWNYSWFALLFSKQDGNIAIFWSRLLNLGATVIPIIYLHWILTVLNLNKKKKYLLYIGYLITSLFVLLSFSSLYIKGVHSISFFPFWPTAGPFYKWFLLFGYFLMIGYAFYKLIEGFKKSEGEKKYQITYIIIGSILGFGGGATNFPLMYGFNILPSLSVFLGIFAIMFSPFIFSYAAVKYRLMNIKIIATQLFGGVLGLILLINFLTSENIQEWFVRGFLLILSLIFIVLFIKGVLKEVETREQMEKLAGELGVANEKLKKLDQAKTEFLSIASHQLRSPLTAIKGYSSMIMEGSYGAISDKVKETIDKIFVSSNRLVSIIGDFLDVSRIELGKMQYEFTDFDIREMINNLTEEFKANYKHQNIELNFESKDAGKIMINADFGKIRQIISNIIDNAMKYTDKGFVRVFLSQSPTRDKILIAIKDSGRGMDKDDIDKIFQKFSRANGAAKSRTQGSGLGLYVASEMVKAHKGRIWAESEGIGKGSTFFVELSLRGVPPHIIQQEKQRMEQEKKEKEEKFKKFLTDI